MSPASFPSVSRAKKVGPAACVSTARAYRVRARQLNTIVVHIRVAGKGVAGARVKFTAPGLHKIKKTNARGIATLRIRPRRSGTIYVQSDQCAGVDRVAVLAAKRASGDVVPRFTG